MNTREVGKSAKKQIKQGRVQTRRGKLQLAVWFKEAVLTQGPLGKVVGGESEESAGPRSCRPCSLGRILELTFRACRKAPIVQARHNGGSEQSDCRE